MGRNDDLCARTKSALSHALVAQAATELASGSPRAARALLERVNDDHLHATVLYLRGRLFPYRIGGVPQIEVFEGNRRAGLAQLLMRGANPTTKLGWFVCEKLVRANTFLSGEGLGQQINFEAQMARVPTPQDPDGLLFAQNAAVGNI